MAKLKVGKSEDLAARIEDPGVLREAFQQLYESEAEFPIKVEGTHTLPYFATLKRLAWDEGYLVLKLVRPLPHELMVGAVFQFLCAAGEQRFEGLFNYAGREGYLQYRFEVPKHLMLSDRRQHKRYPFRPRESAYVILQDAGLPGLGVAGPLVNLSLGGLALRVDRVIKLDSGVRVPPGTALFERGKGFPRIRIQDLPRVHLLEARGTAAHAHERGSEVILGLAFAGLSEDEDRALRSALEIRERMLQGTLVSRSETGTVEGRTGEGRSTGARPEPAAEAGPAPDGAALLRLLRRRATLVAVVAHDELRASLEARLREAGFHRLLGAASLAELADEVALQPRRQAPRLALIDLSVAHAGDAEPLQAVRAIEGQLAEVGTMPVAILCEAVDPTLYLAQAEGTRFMGPELVAEELEELDRLLEG